MNWCLKIGWCIVLVMASPLLGSPYFWTGASSSNDNWSAPENWNLGAPANDGTSDLFFGGIARLNPLADVPYAIQSITFSIGAGSFSLQGQNLNLGPCGLSQQDDSPQAIANAIKLTNTQTWLTNGNGSLAVSGAIDLNATALTFQTAPSASAIDLEVSGKMSNGSVIKNGAGVVRFSGSIANEFTSANFINDGTLELAKTSGNSIGNTITVGTASGPAARLKLIYADQIADSATIELNTSGIFDLNGKNDLIGRLNFTGGTASNNSGTLTINRGITGKVSSSQATITGTYKFGMLNLPIDVADSPAQVADLTIDGAITAGGFTKSGAGTLVLTGATSNTYTGPTTVVGGLLQLKKAGNALAMGGDLVVGGLASNGSEAGVVEIASNGQIGSASFVTVNPGSVFNLGASTTNMQALILNGGTVSSDSGSSLGVRTSISNMGGAGETTVASLVNLNFLNVEFKTGSTAAVKTTFTGVITFGGMTVSGKGTLALMGQNNFHQGFVLNDGIVQLGHDSAIGSFSTMTLAGGTLEAVGGARTIDRAVAVTGNATFGGNFAMDFINSLTVSAGTSMTFNNTQPITFSGAMGGSALNKLGNGTLIVAGTTSYAGPTTISAGTLISRGNMASSFKVAVSGSGVFAIATSQSIKALEITGSGLAKIDGASPGVTLKTESLSLAGGTQLDVANGAIIIDYAFGNSPLEWVRQKIATGYANGTWNGAGIISNVAAGNGAMAIAYSEALTILGAGTHGFVNGAADDTSVLIRYTLAGDATLDGAVDFQDLVKLAQNYGNSSGNALWTAGDFNYDGNVDFQDLVKLAQNYGGALPADIPMTSAGFEADFNIALANVPEPTWVHAAFFSALFLRRKSRLISG